MATAQENDVLLEIRHEYREKRKQLKRYDGFIDHHQALVVFLPLLLVLIGFLAIVALTNGATVKQASGNIAVISIGVASLILLLGAIIMAFVTGGRKSAKAKIEKQLENLKQEVVAFQRHAKDHKDISRDELGLWHDIKQKDKAEKRTNNGGWVMFVIVIVVVAAVVSINQASERSKEEAVRKAEQAEFQRQQQETRDRLYQEQRNANESHKSTKPTQCISSGVGSTVYTNCY